MCPAVSELDHLYSQVIRVKARLESSISLLEFGTCGDAKYGDTSNKTKDISTAKQQNLSGLANQLSRHNEELKTLYKRIRPDLHHQQQSSWDRRLEKVDEDTKLLVLSVDKALGYMSIRQEAELDRQKLLENSYARRRDKYKNMTSERLMEEESQKLDSSALMVTTMIQQGTHTVMNLQAQRKILKSTMSKMKGAAMSLGVSASLINAVENRFRSDRMLTYGGMLAVSLFIYVFYHWWKGWHIFWWFPSRLIGSIFSIIWSAFRSNNAPIDETVM